VATSPCRVLFMPFFFLPETWNGMDEHMLLLSRYLDASRYQTVVLAQEDHGPQTALLAERAGIELLVAPYKPGDAGPVRLRHLREILLSGGFSLLHVHSPVAGGLLWPSLAARMARAKTIVTYHQVQPWRMPLKTRAMNRLTHAWLVAKTLAVSPAVERTLRHNAGLAACGSEIVANGIELESAQSAPASFPLLHHGRVRLGYFGRLSPEKGLACLLRAIAMVRDSQTPVHLFLAGDGPQKRQLEKVAADLDVHDCVTFLGFRDDARGLMSTMDVIVHVPEYEGFGLVLLEAMAAARPLIVNDAPGGMTDLVEDGVNGIVVPAGSPERLASAITRLADDEAGRQQLGANGYRICSERYSAAAFAKRVEHVYDSALSAV
jgi:glycosyltransferase involved in cell wall biosynthesis